MALLYDIVESPTRPDLAAHCAKLGHVREVFTSQRKAMAQLKRHPPDLIAVDFFYGFGNNYAGANVSNLDVLLRSAQRFAPQARVIVFAEPAQAPHLAKLAALFTLQACLITPSSATDIEAALR